MATKPKHDDEAAWELVINAKTVRTGRGKKQNKWDPATDDKAAILKDIMGPSGNLRAPTWKIGNEILVGFNLELYEEVFG